MDSGIPLNIVYSKILEKVIVKAVYDQNDDFLFWSCFSSNKKTIKKIFPDLDLSTINFNTDDITHFETFDLRLGKKIVIDLNKLDCVSIPELPFEFSPAFLFNERFESKIKAFPFQKIQKKTIFELKKYSIVSNKETKESTMITPKVAFLSKVQPGCEKLHIANSEAFSNKKNVLKTAFLEYKKILNKHFDYLFSEFSIERKNLNDRLAKGCPFSADSLKALDELEAAAKHEKTNISIEKFLIPLDMLTSWPKSLLPAPDWIITDDIIIKSINDYKIGIIYNKEKFIEYYKDVVKTIGSFFKVKIHKHQDNSVEVKYLGIKYNDSGVEVFSIPTTHYIAEYTNFIPFNITICTNAYAINHLFFEKDDNNYVEESTGYSLEIKDEIVYIKKNNGEIVFEATRLSDTPLSFDEVISEITKFLIVG